MKARLQLLTALAMTIVMSVSALAFASPQAEAKPDSIANGVRIENGQYYCGGSPATPINAHTIEGTNSADVILAMGDDVKFVHGNGGRDIICVVTPGAVITGGAGADRIYTPHLPADWPDHLAPPIATTKGGPGNDLIVGGSSWDNISGGDGDDRIYGGAGYDYLWGDAGVDRIDGGPNGTRAPTGVDVAGDLCLDADLTSGAMAPAIVECERGARDPFASADIPDEPVVPDPQDQGCKHLGRRPCGFSHFR